MPVNSMLTKRWIIGLARECQARRDMVATAEQVCFGDLGDADLSGMDLSGKRFFGCLLSGCNLSGAILQGSRFDTCFVADPLPQVEHALLRDVSIHHCNFMFVNDSPQISLRNDVWESNVAEAVAAGLRGDTEPVFRELRRCIASGDTRGASPLLALCALWLRSQSWECRLRSISVLSDGMLRLPEAMGSMRDAYLAALLCRTGDKSDTVYYPALDLIDTFEPEAPVIRFVFGRIESAEPMERQEALIGARRILARHGYESLFPMDGLERVLDDVQQPPDILCEALRALGEQLDTLELSEERALEQFSSVLVRLLRNDDVRVRRETLRVVVHFHGWAHRAQIIELLSDDREDIRTRAFMTLYRITPAAELRALLDDHPPDRNAHAEIVAHQEYLRQKGWTNSLIADDELRALLTSTDPAVQGSGLYYAGLLGDDAYLPELMNVLQHGEAPLRCAALRAIAYLVRPPTAEALYFLHDDPDESVRAQLVTTLASIAEKR